MAAKSPPAWLEALIGDSGLGISELLVDRAAWLDNPLDEPWVTALEELRHEGKKEALITLLRSDVELTPEARWFLADMLDRYDLKKPAARPRTPIYDLPPSEVPFYYALNDVRERDRRMSAADAIKDAAAKWNLSIESLTKAYNGRRGSTRRIKKRTRPKDS